MQLCIFNPEHDLCLAKGRAHYVPPRSAVDFACRDASIMQVLYPEAVCCSVYDLGPQAASLRKTDGPQAASLRKMDGTQAASLRKVGGTQTASLRKTDGTQAASLRKTDGTQAASLRKTDGTQAASLRKTDGTQAASLWKTDGTQVASLRKTDGTQAASLRSVIAWGWDAVVKHELLKRGLPSELLPTDEEIAIIRELQHRSTILSLQPDCHEVHSIEDMESLLCTRDHWVLKAPWSGAGRGLRWVHGALTSIDRDWLHKTVASQRCAIAEPRRDVLADIALEYWIPATQAASPRSIPTFLGYSYFRTGRGVYKENVLWSDDRIETEFAHTDLQRVRARVERWLADTVCPRYRGPLGIDLMVCPDGRVHVAEMNLRHTMGMVAHARINSKQPV